MADSVTFSHSGICVTDLERSLRFYCEGLGFVVAEGYDLDDTMLPGLAGALEVESPVALRSQMITCGALPRRAPGVRHAHTDGRPVTEPRRGGPHPPEFRRR